jgi:hypothetical protein
VIPRCAEPDPSCCGRHAGPLRHCTLDLHAFLQEIDAIRRSYEEREGSSAWLGWILNQHGSRHYSVHLSNRSGVRTGPFGRFVRNSSRHGRSRAPMQLACDKAAQQRVTNGTSQALNLRITSCWPSLHMGRAKAVRQPRENQAHKPSTCVKIERKRQGQQRQEKPKEGTVTRRRSLDFLEFADAHDAEEQVSGC